MGLRKTSPLNILPRKRDYPHPYIPELIEELRRKRVSRREFLRTSTLLGLSATTAYAIAARITGQPLTPTAHAQAGKGGVLKVGTRVQEMTDPSTFDWTPKSNVARLMVEYLVITGPDNVTRPYLAEKWQASPDLKTWTFHLRKGITWSNGDPFNADDVAFNFRRWLDPKTGSSNLGLFASMTDEVTGADGKKVKKMTEGAVEKVDAHTVRLHLNRPELAVPENCYNYPTAIVHRSFEEWGKDLSKKPVGTGPYELVEFKVGERAVLRKRKAPYWGGEVSLDEIHFIDLGDDRNAMVGALASGQINYTIDLNIAQLDVVKSLPGVQLFEAVTAQTAVARMQVTQKPFDNKKLRQALQACINHDQVLQLAYRGKGVPGEDHHVSPIHPEYFKLPAVKPDIEKAKALLKEAGHPGGIQLAIDCNNDAEVGDRLGAGDGRDVEAGRDQREDQRPARDPVLGELDQDAVRHDRLDAPPARRDGAQSRLPLRRAVERDQVQQSRVRQGARRGVQHPRRERAAQEDGDWWRRSCRTTRSSCSRCGARCSPPAARRCTT